MQYSNKVYKISYQWNQAKNWGLLTPNSVLLIEHHRLSSTVKYSLSYRPFKWHILLFFINRWIVSFSSDFSVKLCLLIPTRTRLCPLWKLEAQTIILKKDLWSHNILLLSLKTSGEIKQFQLYHERAALFHRLTEFKILEIIELLFSLLFQNI